MIYSFKIQNFRSVLDETIQLSYAEGKAPNGYKELDIIPFLEVKKYRIVPCLMFFGQNAGGKTNLIRAMFHFKALIFNGINNQFMPNKLNDKYKNTKFEIEFFTPSSDKFNYLIEYNSEEILREVLIKNNNILYEITKEKTNFKNIEAKGYSERDFKNLLDVECSKISTFTKEENKLQQYTFLSKVIFKYPGLSKSLSDAFGYFNDKLKIYPINKFPHSLAIDELSDSENNEDIKASFNRISNLIQKLDIDIEDFTFSRNTEEYNRVQDIQVSHKKPSKFKFYKNKVLVETDDITTKHKNIRDELVDFTLDEESMGTQILLGLIGICLSVLDNGGVLVIDELDRSLHPLLFIQIVRLFKDKRYNKNNAQLIFTTHTTDLLDDAIIRISEVGIITKTLKEGTKLKRLSDFSDIRNVNNFRKQYLEGRFAGLPFAYI